MKRLIDFFSMEQDAINLDPAWSIIIDPLAEVLELLSQKVDSGLFQRLYSGKLAPPNPHRRAFYWGNSPELLPYNTAQAIQQNWHLLYSEDHIRPAVIQGEPGSGKTTWIRFFFHSELCGSFLCDNLAGIVDYSMPPTIDTQRFQSARIERLYQEAFRVVGNALSKWGPDHYDDSWNERRFGDYKAHEIQYMIGEAVKHLHSLEPKKYVWLVVDNLDYSPRWDQADMVRYARSIMSDLKVETVIAVRPQTIHRGKDLREEFEREGVKPLQVPQYDSASIVDNRTKLCYTDIPLFSSIKSLMLYDWHGKEHHFTSHEDYEKLYDSVCTVLTSNSVAQDFLRTNHNGDLGKLLNDLSGCLRHSVFAAEIVPMIENGQEKDERRFLTSYLRNNYRHHWPENFGCVVNLFQLDPMGPHAERPLLGIRVLELLAANDPPSLEWGQLLMRLTELAYKEPDIVATVTSLLANGVVIDSDHMTDWENRSRTLDENETLFITEKGDYHLRTLLHEHRYISAIAQSQYFEDDVVDNELSKGVDIEAAAQNTAVLVNEIYGYVWEDLGEMESVGGPQLTRKFIVSIQHMEGLFLGCVRHLFSSLQQIVRNDPSQISDTTWEWWRNLEKRARCLKSWRENLLEGQEVSILDYLPLPSHITAAPEVPEGALISLAPGSLITNRLA